MKIILVAHSISRQNLHLYGHPIRFIKKDINDVLYGVRMRVQKLKSLNKKDLDVYKAIYPANKYRVIKTSKLDIFTRFIMVVDDECKEVYKYVCIDNNIELKSFNDKFEDIGLKLKTDMTKKEEVSAIRMLINYEHFNLFEHIFNFYGAVTETAYNQFVRYHFDLLIEQYLTPNQIRTLTSFMWCSIDKGLLFEYISRKCNIMSKNAVINVITILYHAIFTEHISVFPAKHTILRRKNQRVNSAIAGLSSYGFYGSFTNGVNDNIIYEEIRKESINIIKIMFKFIDRNFRVIIGSSNEDIIDIEDYFVGAYYLLGKPDLNDKSLDNYLKNIRRNLELMNHSSLTSLVYEIPYKNFIDDIIENLNDEELSFLLDYSDFRPLRSVIHTEEPISDIQWLSNDELTMSYYNKIISKGEFCEHIMKKRYRIPTRRQALLILSMGSFVITMFYVYSYNNYKEFLNDNLIIKSIFKTHPIIRIIKNLQCNKFVNAKVKEKFLYMLSLHMEHEVELKKLKDYFNTAKKSGIDKELVEYIKNSNFSNLKGAILWNKL